MLKPLSTLVDELELNLASHLAQDYAGDAELLLGVAPDAPARAAAERFAREHPDRVRVVVHEERAGLNPKVNQLIALTREARGEVITSTDPSIRVAPGWLAETVAALEQPGVGLATHLFAGTAARTLGATWDGQVMTTFVSPNVATAASLGMDQIVGKSLALTRDVLSAIGGWEPVKDVLGDDQLLGAALARAGLRSHVCPTPLLSVGGAMPLAAFWARHTRWSMTRFRLVHPGAYLEPLLNPTAFALAAAALAPRRGVPRLALSALGSVAFARACARLLGAQPAGTALFPLQQIAFLAVWLRGATLRRVDWQGHRLHVGAGTELSGMREPAQGG
jgi:ceramide glucosyltransferase